MEQSSKIFDCIKEEYLSGKGGYRALAKKHGVPRRLVAERWKNENWRDLRTGTKREENHTEYACPGIGGTETVSTLTADMTGENPHNEIRSGSVSASVLKDLFPEEKQNSDTSLDSKKVFGTAIQYETNDVLALFLKEIIEDEELRRAYLPGCKEMKDFAAVLKESEQMKRRETGADKEEPEEQKGGIVLLPAVMEVPAEEVKAG